MIAPPWSFSSMSCFITCPRKYHWEYILKNKGPVSAEMAEGTKVHKIFEDYVARRIPELPTNLDTCAAKLKDLRDRPGLVRVERKYGISVKLIPCDFFGKGVWHRGVIDYENVQSKRHHLVDYKTGKMKPKPLQLQMNMVHAFAEGAKEVTAEFYWTKHNVSTPLRMIHPNEAMGVIHKLKPDLRQYVEAHQEDIWQPRQNGLCRGYCGCTGCEYWEPMPPGR